MKKRLIKKRLKDKKKSLETMSKFFLGYPSNTHYDYSSLSDFLRFSFNNVGDPFVESTYALGTRDFEREVLQFFANLYSIPSSNFWGYVTSGGTEGNMHGLFLGREMYPNNILYFSAESHYSISKIARVLNMKSSVVPATQEGAIDIKRLGELIRNNPDHTPIFCLNIGTTMKGGVDDVDGIIALLNHLGIREYYIHCDAALYGMILPFLEGAPHTDFTKPIGSIAISGHKFIGSPVPCGVSLTRRKYIDRARKPIEYIDTLDTTILGSRNALSPIILWYAIKSRGYDGFKEEANTCIKNARYLYDNLKEIGHEPRLNDYSNTVLFNKPSRNMIKKWQLASQGDQSHVVVMQHVTKKKIDQFIDDLKKCNQETSHSTGKK